MKHTPGPWEIRSDFHSVDGFVVYRGRGNDNKTIARFPYGNVIGKPEGWEKRDKQYQEIKANVHLIAAAPELLEALKHLYRLHCEGAFALEDKDYIAITKAAAAIAKAEGK